MSSDAERGLPTWAALVTAFVAPFLIAVAFMTVFDFANQPVDPVEYGRDPGAGQRASDLNDALIFLHALAQMGFVGIGAACFTRPRARLAFLLAAVPVSGFIFLVSLIGLIAK